jgi:hypothetical protein
MLQKAPEAEPTPTPFKREYNEPGLLYPVYNHAMSVSEGEFSAAAYAFLESLARMGAGNPKGIHIYEAEMLSSVQPLLVVDRYLVPLGRRPIVSPQVIDKSEAIAAFVSAGLLVNGRDMSEPTITHQSQDAATAVFSRWVGQAALEQLQQYALMFVEDRLL